MSAILNDNENMQKNNNLNNWLNKLSLRSLQKIKAILEITVSELEIIGIKNGPKEYLIPGRNYNKENFALVDVENVLNNLSRELPIKIKAKSHDWLPAIIVTINDKDILNYFKKIILSLNKKINKFKLNLPKLSYDNDTGTLILDNKEIDFSRKPLQKDLLNTLFTDKNKKWGYDEIIETWGEEYEKGLWKKCYTAATGINKEVFIKTGIKDFILKNTKDSRINPKYI